jgi:hypothetical protein
LLGLGRSRLSPARLLARLGLLLRALSQLLRDLRLFGLGLLLGLDFESRLRRADLAQPTLAALELLGKLIGALAFAVQRVFLRVASSALTSSSSFFSAASMRS